MKFRTKSAILLKKGFDSNPAYNDNKYLETQKKSYQGKVNKIFYNDKMPKEGSHCVFLSVVLIDFVFKKGKNYYPQVFLEERKYIFKEKEVTRHILRTQKLF